MIETLELRNFRNHKHIKVDFLSKNTFIEGLNGSGKTSIVEAINYISTLKSFKTVDDESLVLKDKPYFKIVLKTKKDTYEVVYNEGKKLLKINQKIYKKMSDFIANFKTVIFSPEDLNLIYGFPGIRRSFIDIVMVQINKAHLENLSTYKTILKERNALLKKLSEKSDLTFLKIINKRLEVEADKIITARTLFIEKLNKAFKRRFKSFNNKDDVEVVYKPNTSLNTLEAVLNGKFRADLLTQNTSAGPHRDELLFYFNKNNAKEFASQGQVRLITLSLKLALIDLYDKNEEIVILLDDVFSELDDGVVLELKKLLQLKNQVIFTGTNCIYKEMNILNLSKKENQKNE